MRKMSKEEFLEILSRQQRSGLTIKDFCVNEAYTESSFYYWKGKFGLSRPYHGERSASAQWIYIKTFHIPPSQHNNCRRQSFPDRRFHRHLTVSPFMEGNTRGINSNRGNVFHKRHTNREACSVLRKP